jgi:hypothetical protein
LFLTDVDQKIQFPPQLGINSINKFKYFQTSNKKLTSTLYRNKTALGAGLVPAAKALLEKVPRNWSLPHRRQLGPKSAPLMAGKSLSKPEVVWSHPPKNPLPVPDQCHRFPVLGER